MAAAKTSTVRVAAAIVPPEVKSGIRDEIKTAIDAITTKTHDNTSALATMRELFTISVRHVLTVHPKDPHVDVRLYVGNFCINFVYLTTDYYQLHTAEEFMATCNYICPGLVEKVGDDYVLGKIAATEEKKE